MAAADSRRGQPRSLLLYSEKEQAKADTRVVDPRVLEQIWQEFAPYR